MLTSPHTYLSLKWKLLIFSTLVLLGVASLYSMMALHYYRVQQHALFTHAAGINHQQLTGLTQQSAYRLQQLANQIITKGSFKSELNRRQYNAIKGQFLSTVDQSKGSYHLRSMGLVAVDRRLKAVVGPQLPDPWLIEQTFASGAPQTAVQCQNHCSLYVTHPVRVADRVEWVLILSASVDHLVQDYRMISGSDVALLRLDAEGNGVRPLLPWNASVLEVSSSDRMMSFLSQFSAMYSLDALSDGVLFDSNSDRISWVQMMPMLGTMHKANTLQLVFVDDVTHQVKSQRAILKRDIFFGGAIWFLLQPLLIWGLWRPTDRIQRLLKELPQVSQAHSVTLLDHEQPTSASLYGQVAQQKLLELRDTWEEKKLFKDESYTLVEVVCQFLDRMQETEAQLIKRSELLDHQKIELEKERDFISCLLDHSHAFILTQTSLAAIKMVNRHGVLLTGRNESELLGRPFISLLSYQEELPDIRFQLDELAKGIKSEFSHETEFIRYDGKQVHMVWHHARLPEKDEYGHEILTVAVDISQRKHAEEYLGWLATHDALTGLINRKKFIEELEKVLKSSERYGHQGGLLLFDLDQFKDVNDSSGHHVGDDLLKKVSRVLRKHSKESDVVARLGGDEFAIILMEADDVEAGETAEEMCRALNRIQISGDSTSHKVSTSIGVVIFPRHGRTVEDLQANANLAMCQAKEAGRNGWKLFEDGDETWNLVHERVYWNEMVKKVLEENKFPIYYQPILDLNQNKISHYEALMRIFSPKGEPLSPQKLFLSAEQSGTVQELDLRIMRKVFEQKKILERTGIQTKLSVNLSGLSFKNPHLLSFVTDLFEETEIHPDEIIFEITETAAVSDAKGTRIVMDAIKKLGCRFALDDFGVGFSSLYYLKNFPFDYVKIDGSFIKNITEDMDDQVMVKALVEVAQSFGQYTVAEFVENSEAVDLLQYLRVDFAQGYHVGQPAAPEDLWPAAYAKDADV